MANMLNKYGVPLPSGRNKTMLQPKSKYKFRVVVYNFGTDINDRDHIALDVDQVDRPSVTFNTQKVDMFTTNSSYVTKHNWNPIVLTIRDSVGNESAKALSRQLQKQLDFPRRITSRSEQNYSGYKFGLIIQMLNGRNSEDTLTNLGRDTAVDISSALTNNEGLTNAIDQFIGGSSYNSDGIMEYFVCVGCIIQDINYDSLDYSSSSPVTMKITIKPDNVVQYDTIAEMYNSRINSLLPDEVNQGLDIIDKIFGQAGL
ncbi:hypothetical protein SEPL_195 [Salmonella phage SE_PL]|uniref:hypothetical protein n=1 Tax=Salmonella enterica TaxID=28901 RepID=UPI001163835C|nr:hypothetical protein 7t3_0398 [Salmonella phage 7t3]QIG62808.1 hypothetical protein SEPL_195 [Salmonella phage SE_PL]WNV47338.1 tail tube protein [Klebsiella phage fENko-Kae01]